MKLNRREFVRLGALGSAAMITARCGPGGSTPTPGNSSTPPSATASPIIDAKILIQGLVIAHWAKPSLQVHLIDGALVGMPAHLARLKVPTTMIDPSSTVAHTPDPADINARLIDLTNKSVTLPGTGSAPPNIDVDESAIGSGLPSDNGWRPIRYSAYLPTLCGATQITDSTKFYGSVLINHAKIGCIKPVGLGATTIWTFRNPSTGQPVAPPQVVSDVIQCETKFVPGQAAFMIGNQSLVLVPGQTGEIVISNEPPKGTLGSCPGNKKPCATHLNVYYGLVNASVSPVAEGAEPSGGTAFADPNYCPPSFI